MMLLNLVFLVIVLRMFFFLLLLIIGDIKKLYRVLLVISLFNVFMFLLIVFKVLVVCDRFVKVLVYLLVVVFVFVIMMVWLGLEEEDVDKVLDIEVINVLLWNVDLFFEMKFIFICEICEVGILVVDVMGIMVVLVFVMDCCRVFMFVRCFG